MVSNPSQVDIAKALRSIVISRALFSMVEFVIKIPREEWSGYFSLLRASSDSAESLRFADTVESFVHGIICRDAILDDAAIEFLEKIGGTK